MFSTAALSEHVRVDRMGMPAVNTVLVMAKDDYNAGSPINDANGDYFNDLIASVQALHMALDDDIAALNLDSCAAAQCLIEQASLLIAPDTLKIDMSNPAGFPNGRTLPDQVMDVMLAVILLDLDAESVTTFADLPLNPPANDVEFLADFPYLAPPH